MYSVLIALASIIAILLIIIVLLQSSKGGGLAGTFGGGGGMGTMFGTRRTADFLSRATWILGGTLAALSIIINLYFLPVGTTAQQDSVIQRSGRQQQSAPVNPAPQQQQQQIPGNQN